MNALILAVVGIIMVIILNLTMYSMSLENKEKAKAEAEIMMALDSALSALEAMRDAKYGKSPALKFVELKLQIAKLLKENKELREANNNLQEGLDRYIKVFSHHHQAGQPNQDTCLSCGLDIRENIHIKE